MTCQCSCEYEALRVELARIADAMEDSNSKSARVAALNGLLSNATIFKELQFAASSRGITIGDALVELVDRVVLP